MSRPNKCAANPRLHEVTSTRSPRCCTRAWSDTLLTLPTTTMRWHSHDFIVTRHRSGRQTNPTSHRPSMAIIARASLVNRADRYTTAADFAEALRRSAAVRAAGDSRPHRGRPDHAPADHHPTACNPRRRPCCPPLPITPQSRPPRPPSKSHGPTTTPHTFAASSACSCSVRSLSARRRWHSPYSPAVTCAIDGSDDRSLVRGSPRSGV